MLTDVSVEGRPVKLLAAASGGGHWEQLMMLRDAFAGAECHYVTTLKGLPERDGIASYATVTDCNQQQVVRLLRCLVECMRVVARVRPDVVVTTGAAPGLMCLLAGRMFGAKTIWIDSVANANRLSLSGRLARAAATVRLTQWPHLAGSSGAAYHGSVL